jgi:hypothetical protein
MKTEKSFTAENAEGRRGRFKFLVLLVNVWLAVNLMGCGAISYPQAVQAVDAAATIKGMNEAINGMPGVYALQNGKDFVFGWPSGLKYSWVAFSESGQPVAETLKGLCGNKAYPEAAGEIYKHLTSLGWKEIPPGSIPPAIGASLPMIPVLLMPILVDPMQMINPEVKS